MVHSRSQNFLQASTCFDPISFRPDGRRQGYFANMSRRRETAEQLVRREPQEGEGPNCFDSSSLTDMESPPGAVSHLPGGDHLQLSRDDATPC
jgi:hypothetical protein